MTETIADLFDTYYDNSEEINRVCQTYSNDTIELIKKNLPLSNDSLVSLAIRATDEQTVRELLTLHPLCHRDFAPSHREKFHQFLDIVQGLHEYEQYRNVQLDTLTGTELDIAVALLNVTSAINFYFENRPLITQDSKIYLNRAAADLVAKHYYRTADLIEFFDAKHLGLTDNVLSGLPNLHWYKKQSLNTITEETINTAIDYLYVTAEIASFAEGEGIVSRREEENDTMHLDNPELEQFIEQNPEAIDDLIECIRERHTGNLHVFHEYMNNGTILRTGVL